MAETPPITRETITIAAVQTDNLCDHYIFRDSAAGTPAIQQYNVLKLRLNVRNVTGKIPNATAIGFKLIATGNEYAGADSHVWLITNGSKEIENMTDGTYTIEIPIYNTYNDNSFIGYASSFRPGATEVTEYYYMLVIYIIKQNMTNIVSDTVFLFKNTGVENTFNNMFKTTYTELRQRFNKIAEVINEEGGGGDE